MSPLNPQKVPAGPHAPQRKDAALRPHPLHPPQLLIPPEKYNLISAATKSTLSALDALATLSTVK